jgi:hypothetical protein
MTRRIENPAIFIHHWRWLEGQRLQATSGKLQASSSKLDKKDYNDIQEIKGERLCKQKKL